MDETAPETTLETDPEHTPDSTEADVDEVGRPRFPLRGTEVETLLGFLDHQRATLAWKCRGLTDEQLRATLHPTAMTLAGMLKHLAYVEDYWFTEVVAERTQAPEPWRDVDWAQDGDWDWTSAAADTGAQLRALWERSVERSRAVVAAELDGDAEAGLARAHEAWGGAGSVSLRWVLVHLVEEYARHNGHADLLREAVDGETGE